MLYGSSEGKTEGPSGVGSYEGIDRRTPVGGGMGGKGAVGDATDLAIGETDMAAGLVIGPVDV
jgi:hypothetical protein